MVLVTGGTGFLGTHLLVELCSRGKKVRTIKRPSSDTDFVRKLFSFYGKEELFENIDWIDCDIFDTLSLIEAMNGTEHVYHCAALVSFSGKNSKKISETNVFGTSNIVNAAIEAGIIKICHVSSIAVLGKDQVISENTMWNAGEKHSAYAESKYFAEQQIWRGVAEGIDAVIVRPSVIIGPWKQSSGVGILFDRINKGLKYYTHGSTAYVDVRDTAAIMVNLMDSPVKNDSLIVSAENLGYREFFSMIAESLNKPAPCRSAGKTLTGIAWRLHSIKEFFTGNESGLNKITAEISQTKSSYSNKKLLDTLSFSYTPIRESINNINRFKKFLSYENNLPFS